MIKYDKFGSIAFKMSSGQIEQFRELHKNHNFSNPSAYSMNKCIKGNMKLPFALKKTCSNFSVRNFLDYGCGKNGLINLLRKYKDFNTIDFVGYDPAVQQYAKKPNCECDIVT